MSHSSHGSLIIMFLGLSFHFSTPPVPQTSVSSIFPRLSGHVLACLNAFLEGLSHVWPAQLITSVDESPSICELDITFHVRGFKDAAQARTVKLYYMYKLRFSIFCKTAFELAEYKNSLVVWCSNDVVHNMKHLWYIDPIYTRSQRYTGLS